MSSETIALIAILVALLLRLSPSTRSSKATVLSSWFLRPAVCIPKEMIPQSDKKSAEKPKEDKFEWHDEGVGTLVRIVILAGPVRS